MDKKKLISRSYSVNLILFLLKVRLIYISPFLRALLSRKKKTKKPKLKKVKTKKVFLRTNHIKMYLKYQGVSIMYHRWYLSSNSPQLEAYC